MNGSKIDGALDWLTLTTEKEVLGEQWAETWLRVANGGAVEARFYGFEGRRTEEGCFYGRRVKDGRFILILVGREAHETYKKVTPSPCRVTRVDLATDLWMSEATKHIHEQAAKLLDPDYLAKNKIVYTQGLKGQLGRPSSGNTLYIGSRQSQQFGRLYDKGLKEGVAEEGRWLRYEVEYKSSAASQVLAALHEAGMTKAGQFIIQSCYDWFGDRGVSPNFEPSDDSPQFKVRTFVRESTREKKLMWLRTQVQPTVQYLLSEGLDTQVVSALGLEGWSNKA